MATPSSVPTSIDGVTSLYRRFRPGRFAELRGQDHVVRALQGAVKQGVSHSTDPKVMDRAIKDCKEILDEIMEGKVQEWLN